jgi:lipopolysaccharide/colanic/teichoic acid biosynthesis glycosyltransferase
MFTELYPTPGRVMSKWTHKDAALNAEPHASNLSFVYVGADSELAENYKSIFHAGIIVSTICEIHDFLKALPRGQYPPVICIDVALDKKAISNFYKFLSDKKMLSRVIIIYNEKQLNHSNINFLKENGFVDDVVDFNKPMATLARKIDFLKKVKSSTLKPQYKINSHTLANVIATQKKTVLLKRAIDIIFASVFLLIFTPLFLLIAVAIRIDSRGPIVYSSLRAGRGFKIFRFYKFRTMIVDADKKMEEYAHLNQYSQCGETQVKFVKIANDPRITRLGKILRNCSLDELPQLINVLKGDMSVVGNRPLPLYEASTLTTNEHVERFMAPAGITGLWQIKKRGRSEMSADERIGLDIAYARRYNVVYDMWIVAKTPAALFQKTNA